MRFLRETGTDLEAIPEEFKASPEVVKAMELAQESAYTPTELMAYDEYLDAIRVQQTVRADSFKEGQEEERKKSEAKLEEERKKNEEEKKNMARKMLVRGINIEDVREFTDLPLKVIQSLRP
jgi:predicted transposase/invertase (TIGR01784 family)